MAQPLLQAPPSNWEDQFPAIEAPAPTTNWEDQFPEDTPTAASAPNWEDQFPEDTPAATQPTANWEDQFPEDKPFFDLADTAGAIVDFGRGIVNTTPSAVRTLWEGLERPDKWSPDTIKALEADEAFQREMQAKTEKNRAAGTSSSVGESIREAGSSAGFSFGSMAAALPAAAAGAYLTRSPLGTNLAGGLAGGTAAYRMAGARFLNDSFKDWQTQEEQRLGRPVTEPEKEAAYQELLPLAQNAGLWEAGPEAIGNMATLGAGKVILGLGKNRITDLAKGSLAKLGVKAGAAAGAIGTELATETVTQVGQGLPQAQAEAIAANQDPALAQSAYPVTVEGVTQAFKDVAPQTLALSGLMMGAAGGVRLATRPFRNQPEADAAATPPPLPTATAPTDTPADVLGTPPQPGAASTPTAPQPITPLIDLARRAGSQDRVRLTPEEAAAGLTDPGTLEGDLLTDTRFRPPFQAQPPSPLDPGMFGNVTEGLDTLPTNDLTQPDVTALMPQIGGPVSYEGYQGRLGRDTEGRLVVDTGAALVEVADPRGLTRLPDAPFAFPAVPLQAAPSAPAPQPGNVNAAPAGTGFVAAPGDQVALVDELGKVYVPQNRRLDRTVRVAPDGAVEVLVQRVDQPGRIFRLRGAQAQQAQSALLDAVIAQESQARGIRPPAARSVSQQGSAVPFEEIVSMAAAAIRSGLTEFSAWASAMVRRFGESVRELLVNAWEAATAAANRAAKAPVTFGQQPIERSERSGEGGFLHPGDLPNVITTRLGLQRNAPFRVKQLGARDLLLGSTLPAEMVPLVAKSQNEVKALEQAAAQLARDLQAAETAAVNKRNLPLDVLHGKVTDFLNGVPTAGAVLSAMDPVTYDRARRMRNFIDDLTATVAASLPAGTMRDTLVNNTGSWLRRSYAAFDPNSGWNYDNLLRAAKRGQDIGGRPALDVLRKGAAYLSAQNNYPASMRTAQGLPVPGSTLESDMLDLMNRDKFELSLTGQPGASKNVTSLMRRKDIPQQIRELMGEETNVYKRFVASASFQAQFIRRHHAQLAMRKVGLASGLLSPTRQGVFTQEIPGDGPEWSGLAGLWTTPELWQALQNSHGVAAAGKDIAGYVGRFLRFTSSKAKLNRVALNPDSWMVNGLGGATMMLMNGDWFSGRVAARLMEAVRLMKSGAAKSGDVVNAAQDTLKDIQRDLIARLTAEGVFGAGITVADIEASLPRHTLQWIETDLMRDRLYGAGEGLLIGQGIGRGFGTTARVVGGAVGAAIGGAVGTKKIRSAQNAIADLALTKPDMLFRLTGFLTNYEAALGAGLAPDAAFNEATTRTLNTFPNYAAVPAFLRSLSQFGAINSFVSFMFEMYRNTGWSMRYLAQDLAAPSMAQKRRGLQRLAGAGAVAGLMAGGLPALLALAFGKDDDEPLATDDERNAIFTRWFAAPWERDAILAFSKFDKEGVSYLNTSYLLPQQILGELAMAARNGDNPADAAARIVIRLQTQFAGDSVNLAPLMQAYTNTDGRGRPVTVRDGIEGTWERADHALKVIAEPGFVDKVNRLAYAHREAARRGRTFSVEQEFRRLIGLREMTRTWDDLTLGRYREFDKQIGRIREGANRTLSENLPGAKATAIERANRELTQIRTDLQRFEKEAAKLGVPPGVMFRAKKETGLSLVRNVMVDPIKGNRVKSIGTR